EPFRIHAVESIVLVAATAVAPVQVRRVRDLHDLGRGELTERQDFRCRRAMAVASCGHDGGRQKPDGGREERHTQENQEDGERNGCPSPDHAATLHVEKRRGSTSAFCPLSKTILVLGNILADEY